MDRFVRGLPKAELHCHIEGTLEPEMVFDLAERNEVEISYPSVDALRAAYQFTDLQSFLDIYYQAASVLVTEQDFHDLTWAYLERAAADGVVRAEIFFDPQTHTERGIAMSTVVRGISSALSRGETELGVSSGLIMCFLRHLPLEAAIETMAQAEHHLDDLIAVGLDSSEVGYPPAIFTEVFERAHELGLRRVAHAGEEGPPEYIWQALDLLGAERIDHGVRSLEDRELVDRLIAERIPLTVCPFSNVRLRGVDRLEVHPIRTMLEVGLDVSINSDDPAYFGGYIGQNYIDTAAALGLSIDQIVEIARISLRSTFTDDDTKASMLASLDRYVADHGPG